MSSKKARWIGGILAGLLAVSATAFAIAGSRTAVTTAHIPEGTSQYTSADDKVVFEREDVPEQVAQQDATYQSELADAQ